MPFDIRSLIAQSLLQNEGHYTGKLDGIWGPRSIAAADAWNEAELDEIIPRRPITPYSLARRHLGQKEIPGSQHNPLIVRWLRLLATWINEDETAWCSAFVDAMAREAGYERTGKLNARSWLDIGEKIAPRDARPGDIAIFWRGSPTSWQGHVAFVDSFPPGASSLRVLGGNQKDSVSIAPYAASTLLGIRRLRPLARLQ